MKEKKILGKIPGVLYGLILIMAFFAVMAPGFIGIYNLQNLLKDCSILVIISLGMNLVILTGRINISIGGVMSLTGVITAMLMQDGLPMGAAILLGLLLGIVIGALLGYMIAYLKFNDWVVSYAVMGICSGVALAITEGNTIPIASQTFRLLASGRFLGIYIMIWLAILLCLLMIYLSTSTTFGYNVYSMGGSEMSARLAGIKTRRVLLITYIISGFLAAVSGILLVAKTNSASPIGGSGYEWDAIAAVLIGGTVFSGGVGRVSGCIVGAALMRTLRNGLTMIGLSPYWQTFIIGITVMIIIIADGIGERRKRVQMLKRVYKS
mgnify:FL=1